MSDDLVRRYKLVRGEPGYRDTMCVRPDGAYVLWLDYEALADRIEAQDKLIAEMRGALRELSIRAKAVVRAGATTGPQWVHLTGAGLRADALLARLEGGEG